MGRIHSPYDRPRSRGTAGPPETVTGQPFQRTVTLAIQSISDQGNDVWRYQFSSGADVSVWKHLSEAEFTGCDNAANDGIFPIEAVDLVNSRVDVTNSSGVAQVGDGGDIARLIYGHAIHTDSTITSGSLSIDAPDGFKTEKYTATVTPTQLPTTAAVGRKVFTVYNLDDTEKVYLGSSASHTTANSIPIFPQDAWSFELSDDASNTYFFTASGTVDVLIVEGF